MKYIVGKYTQQTEAISTIQALDEAGFSKNGVRLVDDEYHLVDDDSRGSTIVVRAVYPYIDTIERIMKETGAARIQQVRSNRQIADRETKQLDSVFAVD